MCVTAYDTRSLLGDRGSAPCIRGGRHSKYCVLFKGMSEMSHSRRLGEGSLSLTPLALGVTHSRGGSASTLSARARDVVDVVVHLLPRRQLLSRWPRAVRGRDRDGAGDQEERALLLKSYRVRRGAL